MTRKMVKSTNYVEGTAKLKCLGARMSLFWVQMRKMSVHLKIRKPGGCG